MDPELLATFRALPVVPWDPAVLSEEDILALAQRLVGKMDPPEDAVVALVAAFTPKMTLEF